MANNAKRQKTLNFMYAGYRGLIWLITYIFGLLIAEQKKNNFIQLAFQMTHFDLQTIHSSIQTNSFFELSKMLNIRPKEVNTAQKAIMADSNTENFMSFIV